MIKTIEKDGKVYKYKQLHAFMLLELLGQVEGDAREWILHNVEKYEEIIFSIFKLAMIEPKITTIEDFYAMDEEVVLKIYVDLLSQRNFLGGSR